MNPFTEKSDKELQAYFPDYQQLRSPDRSKPLTNPEFSRILADYKSRLGPIGEFVVLHYFFEEVFHRWEKTLPND